jgi:phage portal protein BeeE
MKGRSLVLVGKNEGDTSPRVEMLSDLSFGDRVRAALTVMGWPVVGKASRDMPDWPAQWMNQMFYLAQNDLDPLEAFLKTPTVAAGVEQLQRDIGQGKWIVWQGTGKSRRKLERTFKRVDEGGNLLDLLCYANEERTGRQELADTVGSLLLNGNAYWFLQFFGSGKSPVEYRSLPGQDMRPVPGENRTMRGFMHRRAGLSAWEPVDVRNVIQFPRYNPKDEPVGLSPLTAVREAYLGEYYALQWQRDFFKNGAVLPGVWTTDLGGKDGLPVGPAMSPAKIRELQESIARLHGPKAGRWMPVIVQGLKFLAAGMTLNEMKLEEQLAIIEAKIIRALGIPPVMMGIKKGGGLSDAGASTDLSNYWLSGVVPMAEWIDDILTERLAPLFGKQLEVELSYDHVLAIADARLNQAKSLSILAGGVAIITRNEAREEMGRETTQRPEDDQLYDAPKPTFPAVGADSGAIPNAPDVKPPTKNSSRLSLVTRNAEQLGRRKKSAKGLAAMSDSLLALCVERLAGQRAYALREVKAWVKRSGVAAAKNGARKVALDALDMNSLVPESDPEDEARFKKALERIVRERGVEALADVEAIANVALEVGFDANNARAARFLTDQAARALSIPDQTTREMLQKNLAAAVEAGGSLEQMIAAVHDTFDARRNQALTIARTESLSAYNFAAQEAYQQSGVVDQMEWLTSRSGLGGRHSEDPNGIYGASDGGQGLDGQVRAIGDTFDVGGTEMQFPGDPGAPPGETCNCVCTTAPVVNQALLANRIEAIRLRKALSQSADDSGAAPTNRIARILVGRR